MFPRASSPSPPLSLYIHMCVCVCVCVACTSILSIVFQQPRRPCSTSERLIPSTGEAMEPVFHGAIVICMEDEQEEFSGSISLSSDSRDSVGSASSDLTDDATSPSPTSPPPAPAVTSPSCGHVSGPLYELSSLTAQLPAKRGLSKFFSGKSQSFTSLSNVRCVQDLAKKETPYRRKMKPCKSYGGTMDLSNKSYFPPGPFSKAISKKSSRGSCASLAAKRSNSTLFCSPKPRPVPVQKHM